MTYVAHADRYEQTSYRRCGASGIDRPPVSLGLCWDRDLLTSRYLTGHPDWVARQPAGLDLAGDAV